PVAPPLAPTVVADPDAPHQEIP
ncbi:MAG TPA: cell division protein FtsB, partial [Stenotrophomonas sp.]|nr:cell division protein FtsB [Stenotrophomonas sp.]